MVGLLAIYLFFVFLKQGIHQRRELRGISLIVAAVLLPSLVMIHFAGDWDLSNGGDFSIGDHWWVVPVKVGELEGKDQFQYCNLIVGALILSLLYIGVTTAVFFLDQYFRWKKQGHLLAIHKLLIKLTVLLLGLIIYLKSQGVSLTPLWVGMGAASLVLGFALQEPLSSLFKGVALDMEGVFRRGEWIRVGGKDGIAGMVVEKNWRTTRLMTINDELVTVPNSVLGSETIINYHQPTPAHVHRLYLGTSYNDPPVKVKEVLRTILMRNPRVRSDPAPLVKTIKYNDFSIDYELKFWIWNYGEHPKIYDEIMTQVWYAFKFYGIEIPFPIRTVHMKEMEHLSRESVAIKENLEDIDSFLKTLPFFTSHLNYKDFEFLTRNSFQRRYTPNEHVIYRGDVGDAIYIVRTGWCEVVLANGERRRIDSGSYFGEMGLISSRPRSADVVAGAEGSVTIRIDRECMQILFKRYPDLLEEFEHVKDQRMEDAGLIHTPETVKEDPFMTRLVRGLGDFLIPW